MSKLYSYLIYSFALAFSCTATTTAQSIWHTYESPKEISVEYIHPNLKDIFGTFTGYALNLTGRFSLTEDKTLSVQVPYAKGTQEYSDYWYSINESQEALGNLYIGLESRRDSGLTSMNLGIYLPTSPNNKGFALLTGIWADPDRYESFIPDYFIFSFRVNRMLTYSRENKFGLLLRFGVSGLILTNRQYSGQDGFEAFINYAIQPTYSVDNLSFIFGFSGKLILNSGGDVAHSFLHQFGLAASYTTGHLRPELFIRVPLNDNLTNAINSTYGGSIAYEF